MDRRRIVLACIAVTGCGRLGFDAVTGDAPGHDEDGDGIADVNDPCPHVAGDAADRDRDGVGDACDPLPDVASSRFVVFSTMQPGDQPFAAIPTFDQEADAIHTAAPQNAMSIFGTFGTVRVDVGYEIRALVGTGQHQIASGVERSGGGVYYFAELNDEGAVRNVSITSFDQTNGYSLLGGVMHNGVHPGIGMLRYDAVAGMAPHYELVTGWVGELYMANAATPMYGGGEQLRFVLNGIDVAVRYVVVIATD